MASKTGFELLLSFLMLFYNPLLFVKLFCTLLFFCMMTRSRGVGQAVPGCLGEAFTTGSRQPPLSFTALPCSAVPPAAVVQRENICLS